MDSPSVLIVGAGAVGAFIGAALAQQGARVSVVCRSDREAVARDGFEIRSELLGDRVFRPERVLADAAEYPGAPDYLILTSKVLPGLDRAALIRPAVGRDTCLVLVQNGIDIEEEVHTAFPDNELLSGIAFVGVARTRPGRVHHQSAGWLVLGRYPSGITPAAQRLAALLEAGRIGCRLTGDVLTARWQKGVWNAVFNPLSILGGVLDTGALLGTPQAEALVRKAMLEVCNIAAANGHVLAPPIVDQMIAGTRAMPPYKTSMALDYENGRALELEAILGNTVRRAQRHGVPIPVLDTIYALAGLVERHRR